VRKRLRIAMLCVAVVGTLVVAAPAQAVNEWICTGPPSAGFTDVSASSPHLMDIDCLAALGITTEQGTFNPSGAVSRWQMALFLTRTYTSLAPPGTDQGFTDIASLPADTQTAINQVRELSITTGTTSTTYGPNDSVTRWQMALFLTRFVHASGVALPSGESQGFTDIGSLSAEAQLAINQVKQLGITTGTSATTYAPDQPVTREQMASFLIRAFRVTYTLQFFAGDCTPPLPADPNEPAAPGTVCRGEDTFFADTAFVLRMGWAYGGPFETPTDEVEYNSPGTRTEIWIDGIQQATVNREVILHAMRYKRSSVEVPGLTGVHEVETRFFWNGVLDYTTIITVTFE
jgi:hypothetical protein